MAKHLKFVEEKIPNLKTKKYWVVNKHDDIYLGAIDWYNQWRKYAFFPMIGTVYEEDCLQDIAQFIKNLTLLHKEKLKKAKLCQK